MREKFSYRELIWKFAEQRLELLLKFRKMLFWKEHIIDAVDGIEFQLHVIRSIRTFVMVETHRFDDIMHKVSPCCDQDIYLPVSYHIAHDLSHACRHHRACKPEEFRAFLIADHFPVYLHSFAEATCSECAA